MPEPLEDQRMSVSLSRLPQIVPALAPKVAQIGACRIVLLAGGATACIAGFALTGTPATQRAADAAAPDLAHLLRMMALLKLALAVGAACLVDWRLRQPVSARVAAGYLLAAGLVVTAPGLIWGLAHVVLGAALFHAGLALLIVLACTDGGVRLHPSKAR